MQMCLADGDNFAVVNQRYFDLEFGRTILVVPLKDGSLRISQLDIGMEAITTHHLMKGGLKNKTSIFKEDLEKDERVKTFFDRADRL